MILKISNTQKKKKFTTSLDSTLLYIPKGKERKLMLKRLILWTFFAPLCQNISSKGKKKKTNSSLDFQSKKVKHVTTAMNILGLGPFWQIYEYTIFFWLNTQKVEYQDRLGTIPCKVALEPSRRSSIHALADGCASAWYSCARRLNLFKWTNMRAECSAMCVGGGEGGVQCEHARRVSPMVKMTRYTFIWILDIYMKEAYKKRQEKSHNFNMGKSSTVLCTFHTECF